ncbi:alpha/beta fold hydrolase [Kitasatospora sp. NPDC056181]|uniref:alpha/beta fold hydrolase n=1 Tax=Kitasatospora sp. NPDC056181 TaxID=3345737 RepID=UPI0035D70B7C
MPFASPEYEAQWQPLAEVTVRGEQVRVMHRPERAAGIPVLLMHGLEESWQSWLPVTERLPERYCPLLADLPWRANGDYSWSETLPPSGWLAEVVRALPRTPQALVGHSFGSNTVLEYLAAPDPAPIRTAVLTSPVFRKSREEITWDLLRQSIDNFRHIISSGLRVRSEGRDFDPEVFEKMVDAIVERVGPNGFVNLFRVFGHSPFIRLDRIDVPVLVVGGTTEATSTSTGLRALVAGLPQGSLALLDEYDHFCQVVQADEVAALVADHLDRRL